MKKHLATFIALTVVATGAFAQASITITPPKITSWNQPVSGFGTVTASQSDLDTLNGQLGTQFKALEDSLNTQFFNKMKAFSDLNKGFANANSAAFDNASFLGYQNYDLFAVALGGNLGLAVPSLDPTGAQSALNDVVNKGDIYVGLATGGVAVQAGMNLGFLLPKLYGTAKFGFMPAIPNDTLSYQQGMFGVGANYNLVNGFDLLFGLVKWRGLNVGSGLVFNGNKVTATVPIDKQTQTFNTSVGGHSVSVDATADNNKAHLTIETSSVVIPIDLATSIQALWFLNVGLGVGADLALSGGSVQLGATSDLKLISSGGLFGSDPGSVTIKTSDAKNGGDFFMPRIAASLGLNLAIFKLDVPVSYYPLSKAFSAGVTGAVVW